jgi:hypothetical protein
MTLVTCNLCAGVVTGVSRIRPLSAQLGRTQGGRHRGRSESKAEALIKLRNAPIPTGRHRLEAK